MYKDYYCDLLQNLPPDWEKVTIEKLGTIYSGGTPSRDVPSFWNGSIAWVTPGELTTLQGKWITKTREYITESGLLSSSAQLLPKGSLLVTTRATIGYVAVAATAISTNQGFKSLIVKQLASSNFYYHLFKFITPEIKKKSCGSTFPEISRQDFKSILVPQPPLFEQQQIAQILDTIDEAIARTSSLIAKLKQMKAGLLHDLLTRGLDENGELRDAIAHPEQFKDSPLGQIPKDWETPTFEEVTVDDAPICYGIVQPGDHIESGVPVIAIQNLNTDYRTNIHKSVQAIENSYVRSRVCSNDLLLSVKGTIGRVGIVPSWFIGNISRDVARIRLKSLASPQYVRQMLIAPSSQKRLAQAVVGTTRSEVSIGILKKLRLPIPCLLEQNVIADVLNAHDTRIHIEETYLNKLKLQKQGLMQDLLTGKVRVN